MSKITDDQHKLFMLRLNEAFDENNQDDIVFILREMVSLEGFDKISKEIGVTREALYKMLGPNGNPRLENLFKLLGALGFYFGAVEQVGNFRISYKPKKAE